MSSPAAGPGRPEPRLAVVMNPSKFDDAGHFRAEVTAAAARTGLPPPLWLETTPEDPGTGQVRAALAAGAGLVLAAGGDGTVTACGGALAGSSVPLAIVPCGTGNVLARNLGVPLRRQAAVRVALEGSDRPLDVAMVNGHPFLVMAGAGFDAKMLVGATSERKRRLGWAAYPLAAVRHLYDRPMRVTVRADGGEQVQRRASAVIVGNVGFLQGGIPLLPDARPDDGLLDAVVLSARGWAGWLLLAAHVFSRRASTSRVTRLRGRELHVDLGREQPWELDGEPMGEARQLHLSVQGSILVRVPRPDP